RDTPADGREKPQTRANSDAGAAESTRRTTLHTQADDGGRHLQGTPDMEDSSAAEDSSPVAQEHGPTDEHETDEHLDGSTKTRAQKGLSGVRPAIVVGAAVVVALGSLAGWWGYRMFETSEAQAQRNQLVAVARQGALNLTTIDYTEV